MNVLRQKKILNKGNYLPSANNSLGIIKKWNKKIKDNINLKENIPIFSIKFQNPKEEWKAY